MLLVMNELSGRLTICILCLSFRFSSNFSRTEIRIVERTVLQKRGKKMGFIRLLVQLGSIENDQIGYFACSYFQLAQNSVNGGENEKFQSGLTVRLDR